MQTLKNVHAFSPSQTCNAVTHDVWDFVAWKKLADLLKVAFQFDQVGGVRQPLGDQVLLEAAPTHVPFGVLQVRQKGPNLLSNEEWNL